LSAMVFRSGATSARSVIQPQAMAHTLVLFQTKKSRGASLASKLQNISLNPMRPSLRLWCSRIF